MPVIEFDGKTTEEAIEKACTQLHVSSDELKFEIVTTGSSGIFGLGSKNACIRINIEEKIAQREPEPPREPRRAQTKTFTPRPRPEAPRREQGPEPRPAEAEERKFKFTPPEAPLPATAIGPGEKVHEGPEDEAMSQARETLATILSHMYLEATVGVRRIEDRIILTIEGENSGLLIGKKGATLNAFQFLVNKIVNRTSTDKQRVIVDTEDYRQRRHQSLIDLAGRMAAKAKRNGRPVTITALSAHDRRVVHLALQNDPGLKTRSRGEGAFKNVILIPTSKRGEYRPEGGRADEPAGEEQKGGDESGLEAAAD